MHLIAIMPVRNEAFILGFSLRALLRWVDSVVVLNHCSEDETPEIIAQVSREFPGRVHLLLEHEPIWNEMFHRQRMLDKARELGATHIVIIDADEVVASSDLLMVRKAVENLDKGHVLQMEWVHLWRSMELWRSNQQWRMKFASMAFYDTPACCWKPRDGYHFHHRDPYGMVRFQKIRPPIPLLHMQHVVWERLLAKQALYKMVERIRWPERERASKVNAKYDATVSEVGLKLSEVPPDWLAGYQDLMPYLDLTSTNIWQSRHCRKLLAEYGPERFSELDLYGVV